MKYFIFTISMLLFSPNLTYAAETCDIEKIIGAKVEAGTYKVTVSREESNFYKIDGQDIYIKTKYCLELALGSTAILEIDAPYSTFNMGKIHFMN